MSLTDWLFKKKGTPDPNYTIIKDGQPVRAYVPLAEEVEEAQNDYLKKMFELLATSAHARSNLAEKTLLNVNRIGKPL
jgi:hypothetical protein